MEAVRRQKEELSEEKAAGIALTRQLMDLKSDSYPDSDKVLAVFEEPFRRFRCVSSATFSWKRERERLQSYSAAERTDIPMQLPAEHRI